MIHCRCCQMKHCITPSLHCECNSSYETQLGRYVLLRESEYKLKYIYAQTKKTSEQQTADYFEIGGAPFSPHVSFRGTHHLL
jgi:hypothetical protein